MSVCALRICKCFRQNHKASTIFMSLSATNLVSELSSGKLTVYLVCVVASFIGTLHVRQASPPRRLWPAPCAARRRSSLLLHVMLLPSPGGASLRSTSWMWPPGHPRRPLGHSVPSARACGLTRHLLSWMPPPAPFMSRSLFICFACRRLVPPAQFSHAQLHQQWHMKFLSLPPSAIASTRKNVELQCTREPRGAGIIICIMIMIIRTS